MDLADLFPEAEYEFRMGIRRGDPAEFFRPSAGYSNITAERRHWFHTDPDAYLGLLAGGERLLDEAIVLFAHLGVVADEDKAALENISEPRQRLQKLSELLEPDLLLLAPGESGQMRLLAGAVCFPSSWRLAEKLGRPMSDIHEPAPGLTKTLGSQIDTFLSRLRPGVAWLRSNWGLSASSELNQHPERHLPRLGPEMTLDETWLRVERQALILLPENRGVLFAIRIESEPLSTIQRKAPEAANRLAHALKTMSDEIAEYKGIASARPGLLAQLCGG